jgi:hypothetical protein
LIRLPSFDRSKVVNFLSNSARFRYFIMTWSPSDGFFLSTTGQNRYL